MTKISIILAEILRASVFVSNPSFTDHERIEHASPLRLTGHPLNGGPMDLEGRSGMHTEVYYYLLFFENHSQCNFMFNL